MNLNLVRSNLQSQINLAVKNNMSIDGARELLIGEMGHQLDRLSVINTLPLSEDQANLLGVKVLELAELYTRLVDHYGESQSDIFPLIEFVEKLRFQDAKSEECILARMLALAEMVDEDTETGWGKVKRAFGMGDQTWVDQVNQIWTNEEQDRTLETNSNLVDA